MLLLDEPQTRPRDRTDGQIDPARRIIDRVLTRFRNCGHRSIGNVSCELLECTLTLHGIVPSFYLKQMAQVIAAQVDGVCELNNHIVVATQKSDERKAI